MNPSPETRRYFYRIALSLVVLAQFFRLIPGDSVDVIVNVITAVFGITTPVLADYNVPKPADD